MGVCKVLLAFPYYRGDQDLALGLAQWMFEMGGCKGHKVLIVRDQGSDSGKDVLIKSELDKSFDSSEVITITGDVFHSWPQSQNLMWSQTARHIQFHTKEPWLWLESDVVILKEKWLDLIEAEYKSCGKLFMGDLVNVHGIPPHMSGVAVWPGEVVQYAGVALISQDVAFDMAAKDQVLPQMHKTNLIAHAWDRDLATGKGNRVFENYEQVEREVLQPHPNAVIFHADKSGSLIRLLNEKRRGLLVNPEWEKASHEVDPTSFQFRERSLQERKLTTDIFIKTYEKDFEWCDYCVRSIAKYASGFDLVNIVSPVMPPFLSKFTAMYRMKPEYGENGYLSQEVFKLKSDEFTDADYILFMDSDTQFVRSVTPETFFKDGKIVWMITPYSETKAPWKPITEKFLKMPVEYETMRRHPIVVPRWVLAEVRDFCQKTHNMSIEEYVMSQPAHEFSEFNVLGAYAYHFHRDRFYWVDTSKVPESEWPILTVNQEWSHNPLDDAMKAKLENILGGTEPSEKNEASSSPEAVSVPPNSLLVSETPTTSELPPEHTGERSFTKERIKGMIQLSPDLYKRGGELVALDPSKPSSLRTQTDAIGFTVDPNQTTITKSEREVMPVSSGEIPDGNQGFKPTNDLGSDELRARMASEKPLPSPWQDKPASRKEIKTIAAVLKLFCTAPIYTKYVRDELKKAGVTK